MSLDYLDGSNKRKQTTAGAANSPIIVGTAGVADKQTGELVVVENCGARVLHTSNDSVIRVEQHVTAINKDGTKTRTPIHEDHGIEK